MPAGQASSRHTTHDHSALEKPSTPSIQSTRATKSVRFLTHRARNDLFHPVPTSSIQARVDLKIHVRKYMCFRSPAKVAHASFLRLFITYSTNTSDDLSPIYLVGGLPDVLHLSRLCHPPSSPGQRLKGFVPVASCSGKRSGRSGLKWDATVSSSASMRVGPQYHGMLSERLVTLSFRFRASKRVFRGAPKHPEEGTKCTSK